MSDYSSNAFDVAMSRFDAAMASGRAGLPSVWGVARYRSMPTSEGLAYSGDLTYLRAGKKVKVGFFEHSGHGGPTITVWIDDTAKSEWHTLADYLLSGVGERDAILVDCLLDKLGK